jgi:putative ABC transport system substrate-binding protein
MGREQRRRLLVASAAMLALPGMAAAQQAKRMRLVGMLLGPAGTDKEVVARTVALEKRLRELGWTRDRDIRLEYRFGGGDESRMPALAKELLALGPDVVVAGGTAAATAFRQQTLSVPIVFAQVSDPVAARLVTNLARPEGNITGFTNFDYAMAEKWLETLKECAPRTNRVSVLFDPGNASWIGFVRVLETSARRFGVELTPSGVRSPGEIEERIGAFAKTPQDALIVIPGTLTTNQRAQIISLAARHRLPAIYPYQFFATSGGLISYGVRLLDLYSGAAGYVDRILRGAKPAELPIQNPTTFELTINLKTAKALGLRIPQPVLARADHLIE